MLIITKRKYRQSAIEDIIELEEKRTYERNPEYITNAHNLTTHLIINYIKRKFNINDYMIEQYKKSNDYK